MDALLDDKVNKNTPQISVRREFPDLLGDEGSRVSAGKNTLSQFDKLRVHFVVKSFWLKLKSDKDVW